MPTITGTTGVNDVITVTGPGEWYLDGDNSPNADPGLPDDLLIVNLQNDTDGIVDRNPIFSTRSWGSRTLSQNDPNYVFIRHDRFERFELNLGSGADSVFTGDGNDVVRSGAGDDFVNTGRGRATVDLGAGVDRWQADLSAFSENGVLDLNNAAAQAFIGGSVAGVESLNLTLGDGAQTIVTLSGARGVGLSDTVNAGGGDDVVKIGGGSDRVSGGAGDDLLIVDLSNDTNGLVNRNPIGDSRAWGSSTLGSSDVGYVFIRHDGFERFDLTLGSGNDDVFTGDGDDVVRSGAGNDVVNTGAGRATVDLGAGVDFWTADLSALTGDGALNLGAGVAQAFMGGSVAGVEQVNLTFGAGAQSVVTLFGAAGAGLNDTLVMGDGDDAVLVGGGSDRVSGGNGNDLLILELSSDTDGIVNRNPIGSSVSLGSRSLGSGDAGYVFLRHDGFERLDARLGSGQDVFTAYAGADVVRAGAGGDTITGGDGDDQLFGQAGDDVLRGGNDNDALIGGAGIDVLTGGAGADRFIYEAVSDSTAAAGDVITDFQTGVDKIDLSAIRVNQISTITQGGATFVFAEEAGTGAKLQIGVTGVVQATDFAGVATNFYMQGDGAANTLIGGSARDVLDGKDGADVLVGGGGTDALFGGAGADTFRYLAVSDSLQANGGADTIFDFQTGVDKLDLSALSLNHVSRIINGVADFLFIEAKDGTIMQINVVGRIQAGDILGGTNQYVIGDGTANFVVAGSGRDVIDGRDGNDVIIGGGDTDALFGGAGADVFRYLGRNDSLVTAADTIFDFQTGVDKIDLTAVRTGAADKFGILTSGGASFLYVDLGGDGTNDMLIQTGTPGLTSADILWA